MRQCRVYDIDHIYTYSGQENTSESDPRSYEATKAVAKKVGSVGIALKPPNVFWAFFAIVLVAS